VCVCVCVCVLEKRERIGEKSTHYTTELNYTSTHICTHTHTLDTHNIPIVAVPVGEIGGGHVITDAHDTVLVHEVVRDCVSVCVCV
jgi:hypothetical protein